MRKLLIVAILAAAVAAFMLLTSLKQEPPKTERTRPDPLVDVLVLEEMTAHFEVRSQGTVKPKTETVLSAEVSGTIIWISPKFVAGGIFSADEELLRIDPTNYVVAVEQAEALVAQRQIEHDGASKLLSRGYRAEAEYASAAAALAGAKAELVRARRNLERTRIRLPYRGMVRAKETDLGQFVNPGSRLGVVFAIDLAEVRLPLTDTDLAFLDLPGAAQIAASGSAEGPRVTLSAVQEGRRVSREAQIVRTEGVVDEKSRVTYAVTRILDPYALDTDAAALPVGTFVDAVIAGKEAHDVIQVPRAVVRGSNQLLFVDDDNKLRIRSVEIVRADADHVYIVSGASPGERVVTTVLETAVNGMPVRVTGEVSKNDDGPGA
ncbi:MAG: efflux RND transporter periplasmic adaptor subunit [Woeseiaceae bacterium]|jgi:RND family efflux transporter MFP subunit